MAPPGIRATCGTFAAVVRKGVALLGRVVAICLAVELLDVPGACPDEFRPASASGIQILAAAGVAGPAIRAIPSSLDSDPPPDCGCPCHQTFGAETAATLPRPTRILEEPPGFVPSNLPPLPRDLRHPPQNLA